jgi:NADH-quinone oxidoreductase subunit L
MGQNESIAWLILLLPLAAVVINLINIAWFDGGSQRVAAQVSIGAALGAFAVSLVLYMFLRQSGAASIAGVTYDWLSIRSESSLAKEFVVSIGLRLDYLSLLMALVVTGVGSLIHIYSAGYMKGDRAYSRYFTCLSLFMFSMLGIVLADNFVMMFIFWELVGVSSYLLIGYWYEHPAAADAAKKAFITNRIGDFGFLLGILIVWNRLGHTVNFEELETYLRQHPDAFGTMATLGGLLIFCGAMGKSAQFPLHVWLPDAMEGPTPVSALIHAATMVAAGVYMLCRVSFLFVPGSDAMTVIAWIGGFTALLAALIAVQQNDIKRILAYSTLSQLGYMVMAVGLSGEKAAMYHLTTHAFFKALLFLGAGSVIHAMHHEQNIWKMGALKRKMPVTYWTFMVGTLALCGVWPLSGFYSKDSILSAALAGNHFMLFALGVFVAILTTFYMFRLVLVVFFGGERTEAVDHAHESPRVMVWPLRILAWLSILGGVMGIDTALNHFFEPQQAAEAISFGEQLFEPFNASPLAATFGLGAIIFGFAAACALYYGRLVDPLPEKLGWLSRAMRNRFYFDELYENVLIPCTQEFASKIAYGCDWLISGVGVRGLHGTTELIGRALRLVQDGSIQTYAFLFGAGMAVVLYFVLR